MIDWIVAEWIAARIAGDGSELITQTGIDGVDLAPLASDAERRVVQYTGLVPRQPLPPPEGIGRREWVKANLASTRSLMDPVLQQAGKGLGKLKPAAELTAGFAMSGEVGLLVGYLGQRVLGQYEVLLIDEGADDHPPRLLFVLPNLAKAVSSFDADPAEFVTWVTLHEVTHAVQFSSAEWLQPHLAGLVHELLDSAEKRIERSAKRSLPNRAELARIGSALRRGDLIGIVASDGEREVIDRVQAVMAVVEGHAEHVMDAVAPELLPSLPRLRRALDSRRRNQSSVSRIVARLLGLEMKMRQYERGKIFCDHVAEHGGREALTYLFSSAAALPTLVEIEDPAGWLARTAPARGAAAA
jgi:coenzyme F420 biosynthesis associated uncharacterized protein